MAHLTHILPCTPRGGRNWRIVLSGAIAVAVVVRPLLASDSVALEDTVKAAFVYKFAPFVTWPQSAGGQEAFRICSYGSDGVTAILARVTTGEQVDKRPIAVQSIQTADQLDGCRIVYIADGAAADGLLSAAKTRPVLTVTQSPLRGMVELVTDQHHVRFDIDLDLVRQSGLVISSKLLGLARSVRTSKEPG